MGKKGVWLFLVCWGFILLSLPAFAASVPDTGQTICYDNNGNVITCPSPGQSFYGQDANYTINPPSYTKLNGMVRDNVTELIWEVKQDKDGTKDYGNPHDADNTYTWYDPDPATNGGNAGTPGDGTDTDDFIADLNSARFGGYSDWRLPGKEELRSICDYGRVNPSINTTYFPNTGSHGYWSSTALADGTSYAWGVAFSDGKGYWGHKSGNGYVRAVRGGQ